jgi:hypothetical protein
MIKIQGDQLRLLHLIWTYLIGMETIASAPFSMLHVRRKQKSNAMWLNDPNVRNTKSATRHAEMWTTGSQKTEQG